MRLEQAQEIVEEVLKPNGPKVMRLAGDVRACSPSAEKYIELTDAMLRGHMKAPWLADKVEAALKAAAPKVVPISKKKKTAAKKKD